MFLEKEKLRDHACISKVPSLNLVGHNFQLLVTKISFLLIFFFFLHLTDLQISMAIRVPDHRTNIFLLVSL